MSWQESNKSTAKTEIISENKVCTISGFQFKTNPNKNILGNEHCFLEKKYYHTHYEIKTLDLKALFIQHGG